jgi:hypothetical protein
MPIRPTVRMKIVLVTIALWLVCVAALAYRHVIVGSQDRAVVTDNYMYWWDYRLAFFLFGWLPILVGVLLLILCIELLFTLPRQR